MRYCCRKINLQFNARRKSMWALTVLQNYCCFLMYGCADTSVLTTDLFSYLQLLVGFSPLTLQPLGSGESVLDVSFLKVVGIIPGFPQHLHPRLLVQAQSLDVLPHPCVWDFIPLLSLCVQPERKKMLGLVSFPFSVTFSLASRGNAWFSTGVPPFLTFLRGHQCICLSSNPLKYQWGDQELWSPPYRSWESWSPSTSQPQTPSSSAELYTQLSH